MNIHYFSQSYKISKKPTKKYMQSIINFVDALTGDGSDLQIFHKVFTSDLNQSNFYFHEYVMKRFFAELVTA